VGWGFWSTQLATIGIPNIAWKERQYERHIGAQVGLRFAGLGRALFALILPPAIRVRSRIGWILQDAHDSTQRRPLPDQYTIRALAHDPRGQVEAVLLQFTHDLSRHAQAAKRLKQIGQPFADLLVRIQVPGAIGRPDIPNR
jgi:hypothetical protein